MNEAVQQQDTDQHDHTETEHLDMTDAEQAAKAAENRAAIEAKQHVITVTVVIGEDDGDTPEARARQAMISRDDDRANDQLRNAANNLLGWFNMGVEMGMLSPQPEDYEDVVEVPDAVHPDNDEPATATEAEDQE